jgi:hypothetical protein
MYCLSRWRRARIATNHQTRSLALTATQILQSEIQWHVASRQSLVLFCVSNGKAISFTFDIRDLDSVARPHSLRVA